MNDNLPTGQAHVMSHVSGESRKVTQTRGLEKFAVMAFVIVNVVGPFVVGERYPFTIAPMFCDQPTEFAEYELYDTAGQRLPLDEFQLQRNYDGNPPGLGVGIKPPPTFDQFGEVPTEAELRRHVKRMLVEHPELDGVRVICRVIGAVDGQHVGELPGRTMEFVVEREGVRS